MRNYAVYSIKFQEVSSQKGFDVHASSGFNRRYWQGSLEWPICYCGSYFHRCWGDLGLFHQWFRSPAWTIKRQNNYRCLRRIIRETTEHFLKKACFLKYNSISNQSRKNTVSNLKCTGNETAIEYLKSILRILKEMFNKRIIYDR